VVLFGVQSLAQMSGGAQRQTAREEERVVGKAIVADTYEQCRARYTHIVDAYTMGAANAISRW
jgi:hypothetical protein